MIQTGGMGPMQICAGWRDTSMEEREGLNDENDRATSGVSRTKRQAVAGCDRGSGAGSGGRSDGPGASGEGDQRRVIRWDA